MTVIPLDAIPRLLAKASAYVESPDEILADPDEATRVLVRALEHADEDLRLRVELAVTMFGECDRLIGPLYEILTDGAEPEDARHRAALFLSRAAPHAADPETLLTRLVEAAEIPDAELRLHATNALGWRGNATAVPVLLDRLHDPDERVRQVAVSSLTNVGDSRLFSTLADRLELADRGQKSAFLLSLWCFEDKRDEAAEIYVRYARHEDAGIRLDALAVLDQVSEVTAHVDLYRERLRDEDERIRQVALRSLSELPAGALAPLRRDIAALADDPIMDVKRLALSVLERLE